MNSLKGTMGRAIQGIQIHRKPKKNFITQKRSTQESWFWTEIKNYKNQG